MGGLTTYSSFNHDLVETGGDGAPGAREVNALATFVVCLASGLLGLWASRPWTAQSP